MAILLGVESSGVLPSVALWHDGALSERWPDEGDRATPQFLPMIQSLLREAGLTYDAIDAYVLGVGPGRFTGLRVGMALLQGLALPSHTPMVGVSSLQVLAHHACQGYNDPRVVLTNAFMGEVFVGIYDANGRALVPDALCKPENLVIPIEGPWLAVGEGWDVYAEALVDHRAKAKAIDAKAIPTASSLLVLGAKAFNRGETQSVFDIQPNYLRLANAWKR